MTGRLEGKVALITGGTSGIGAGTVERLSKEGARVVFTGSNEAAAEKVCAATGAEFIKHNVTDAAAWDGLMAHILDKYGRLDIAFANAGTENGDGSIESITIEGWNAIMGVNLIEKSGDPAATRAAYEGLSPMGRMAAVDEVAGMVAWLASDEAKFCSGSEFTMDGASTAGMNGV